MRLEFPATRMPDGFDAARIVQSRLLWCFVAAFLVSARAIGILPDILLSGAGDTDDAMRLVQVREFLANGAWFDRTLDQVGAPEVLNSHWSRLLDLPIAAIILICSLFMSVEYAELVARVLWPTLLLVALTYIVVREVERRGGVVAVAAVLVFVVCSMITASQFAPGRIDHHNVQILGAVGGTLLLLRSLSEPKFGWWAGLLFGIGLAIGLEALLLVAAIVAFTVAWAGFDPSIRDAVRRVVIACALTVTGAFVLTTAPAHWLDVTCDAASLNLILFLGAIAAALWGLHRYRPDADPVTWFAGLGCAGVAGIGAYLAVEPVCIAGPFGQINREIVPIWLSKVSEGQSLLFLFKILPLTALSFLTFVGTGLAIAIYNYRRERSTINLVSLFVVFAAVVYSCLYVKLLPYAIWLAIPPVAVWIAHLDAINNLPKRVVQAAAIILLNQNSITAVVAAPFGTISKIVGREETTWSQPTRACQPKDLYAELAKAPRGLVAPEINLGPFVALHTSHRVVVGPYHRIDKSIIATDKILNSKPAQSLKVLNEIGANYLVLCQRDEDTIKRKAKPGTLMHVLQSGGGVPYLERLAKTKADSPLLVWRVKR